MSKFGERLRAERCFYKMKRRDLAILLRVSERTVSYWENGQRECNFDTLLEISDLFGISIDYLLGKEY